MALMATTIFGGVALALDLGVQTHHRRSLQNTSDMAALAAARGLPGGALKAAEQTAATDAITSLGQQIGWPAGTPANNGCGGRGYGYCFTASFAGNGGAYTLAFSTPPLTPKNSADNGVNFAQVDLTETSPNSLGSFVGQSQGTTGSHSVAYHYGPTGSFGYALYSQTFVGTGNQVEDVAGDVYIGQLYQPQSRGKAALCADFVPAPPGGDQHGRIIFGAPQPPAGGTTPSVVYNNSPAGCTSGGGGNIYAMAAPGAPPGRCSDGTDWNANLQLCI
ncbi:MAG: Tad domain-containing protein, partial [Candidatus Dormibacteraeota bacterium]|nr:Tad domain-containing protein [Candidatus Dormibacteraeota bacterium]